ncbi:MAG: hypothetical protein ACHQIM_17455, partial [Sphingobacteriales bacterium]
CFFSIKKAKIASFLSNIFLDNINIFTLIKRTATIFLIFLLGFNSFGLSFFYLAEIQLCKIKAEDYANEDHGTGDKRLILISSDSRGIKLVNKTEILTDGKMYDIVKTQKRNGKTLYYALADKDEDGDIQKLTNLEKNSTGERSLPGKTIKLYDAKYFTVEKQHQNIDHSNCLPPGSMAVNKAGFYTSPLKEIFSPPPDYLFS